MRKTIQLDVHGTDVGRRLDVFLASAMDVSRSAAAKWIAAGLVVDQHGRSCKPGQIVAGGEVYRVSPPEPAPSSAMPQDIALDIIYEDGELLVVNKPRGMVVHPAPGHADGTLVNALLHHCGGSLTGVGGVLRPGIVHRLDKDTSGLMLAAKTQRAHEALTAALKARQVGRVYLALVHGIVKQDALTVDAALGRHPVKRKQQAVIAGGRTAVTHVETLRRYAKHTLVKCRLETGRTHQIRVHMAYCHHPVVGDPLYGRRKDGHDAQILHAAELSFTHPVTGERMAFAALLPAYFEKALALAGESTCVYPPAGV